MMMISTTSRPSLLFRLLLPLLVTTLLLGGCQEEVSQAPTETTRTAKEADAAKAEEGFKLVEEVYGDPEVFAQPRIQFLWRSPVQGAGGSEVWSINLDGSDLRRAVPHELIEGSIWYAVRSPDSRYVAMAVSFADRYEKRLVDLKQMSVKTFSEGGNKPAFHWSRDSQTIYFNEDGQFKKYSLPEDRVTHINHLPGGNNYLFFENDTKVVVFDTTYYHIMRVSDGKELRRVDMPKGWVIDDDRVAMSLDEQYIYFDTRESRVDSLVDPDESYSLQRTRPFFFSPLEPGVMHYGLGAKRNFYTGERYIPKDYILPDDGGSAGQLTLINTRVVQGG